MKIHGMFTPFHTTTWGAMIALLAAWSLGIGIITLLVAVADEHNRILEADFVCVICSRTS